LADNSTEWRFQQKVTSAKLRAILDDEDDDDDVVVDTFAVALRAEREFISP